MLDKLLGRAALKERIEELEAELEEAETRRDQLEEQLEAETRRRKEAVREKQDAQETINRTEDRIAQLEGRIDQLTDDERSIDYRGVETVEYDRMAVVLDRLASVDAGPEGALTAVLDGDVPQQVRDAFGDHIALLSRAAPCIAVTDDAGLIAAAFDPPIQPEPRVEWADEFALDRSWFLPTGEYALALVRADIFALGEYRDGERLHVRSFESTIKSDHSKGGFSQGRFERLRDEQIEEHLDRCRDAIANRDADRLLLAGERGALDELDVDAAATVPVDATGDPESALADAHRDVWSTRLYRI